MLWVQVLRYNKNQKYDAHWVSVAGWPAGWLREGRVAAPLLVGAPACRCAVPPLPKSRRNKELMRNTPTHTRRATPPLPRPLPFPQDYFFHKGKSARQLGAASWLPECA